MKIPDDQKRSFVLAFLKPGISNGRLEADEFGRLYQVFATLEMDAPARRKILKTTLLNPSVIVEFEIPESFVENEEIRHALAKEAVARLGSKTENSRVIEEMLETLTVTQKQISFLRSWIAWENKLIKKLGSDDSELADENCYAELLSRAAGVGVPLGSLFYAGIVGFSAVGLTSGLATVGGISGLTLLGLNPMTAGIGALIVAGITIKKLCDVAFGSGRKKRERKKLEEEVNKLRILRQRVSEYAQADLDELNRHSFFSRLTRKGRILNSAKKPLQQVVEAHKLNHKAKDAGVC
ncbi:MAG: hypothetical protein ACI8UO_001040 [Verrucomicrobiales bacterium]|jgi:hypothetical protein